MRWAAAVSNGLIAFVAFSMLAAAGAASASCTAPPLTEASRVRLNSDSVLLVTHASSTYDARLASKRGIDEAVRFAKDQRMPIVVLQDASPAEFYFMEDCAVDYRVASADGDINFEVTPSHVYVVGGHLELCLGRSVNDIIYSWARQSKRKIRDITVTYLMDGIYSNGKSIEESDPYFPDFYRFLDVVTWGRPAGEHWPKVNMLEIMGVIRDESRSVNYLKRVLPRYDRTMPPEYRVDLRHNDGPVTLLRAARGWRPPTLHFEFFDSALKYAEMMH